MALLTDKDTIESLCHHFSERNAEEKGAVEFWNGKLDRFCSQRHSFSFNTEEVVAAFTVHDLFPTSFTKSFAVLKQNSLVVKKKSEIFHETLPLPTYLLTSALSFAASLLTSSAPREEFVFLPLLERASELLLRHAKRLKGADCVVLLTGGADPRQAPFTFHALVDRAAAAACGDNALQSLTEEQTSLLASYLVQQQRAAISADGTVVKLLREAPSSSRGLAALLFAPSAPQINDGEDAVLRLRMSIALLEARAGDLEEKVQAHTRAAAKFKASGSQSLALTQLALRRSTLQARDRVASSLLSLTDAYEKIDGAEVNRLITDAYKAAAVGLRASRQQPDGRTIDADSVEAAIDEFQQEMDEMGEIDAALEEGAARLPVNQLSEEDEEALQAELAELMAGVSIAGEATVAVTSGSSGLQATTNVPKIEPLHVIKSEGKASTGKVLSGAV